MINTTDQQTDNTVLLEKARMMYDILKAQGYPPLLNAEHIADLVGASKNTVQQWIYHRRLPYVKVGGFVRFPIAEIAFFLVNMVNNNHQDEHETQLD